MFSSVRDLDYPHFGTKIKVLWQIVFEIKSKMLTIKIISWQTFWKKAENKAFIWIIFFKTVQNIESGISSCVFHLFLQKCVKDNGPQMRLCWGSRGQGGCIGPQMHTENRSKRLWHLFWWVLEILKGEELRRNLLILLKFCRKNNLENLCDVDDKSQWKKTLNIFVLFLEVL